MRNTACCRTGHDRPESAVTITGIRSCIAQDPQGDADAWCERQRQLYKHDWVVYAKAPLGGPAQVLEYLSRYTHRTAISNERIRAITDREVTFTVRADEHGGKRLQRLAGTEFVRRFMLHVLTTGIKRIRHYGVLASSCIAVKLNAAKLALQMPQPNAKAMESVQAFMVRVAKMDVGLCPCCKMGRLQVTAVLLGQAHLPPPVFSDLPPNRGRGCAWMCRRSRWTGGTSCAGCASD